MTRTNTLVNLLASPVCALSNPSIQRALRATLVQTVSPLDTPTPSFSSPFPGRSAWGAYWRSNKGNKKHSVVIVFWHLNDGYGGEVSYLMCWSTVVWINSLFLSRIRCCSHFPVRHPPKSSLWSQDRQAPITLERKNTNPMYQYSTVDAPRYKGVTPVSYTHLTLPTKA